MKKFSLLLFIVSFGSLSFAQTLTIGTDSGLAGDPVSIPVTLSAAEAHSAALVRIEYATDVLENPVASAGALLSATHVLDSYAPEAGYFNAIVYSPTGTPAFTAASGTLLSVAFSIKSTAPAGLSSIKFTASGTPALAASDLVNVMAEPVTHSSLDGSLTVIDQTDVPSSVWRRYR